jgi:S1-C subfamily serine protease
MGLSVVVVILLSYFANQRSCLHLSLNDEDSDNNSYNYPQLQVNDSVSSNSRTRNNNMSQNAHGVCRIEVAKVEWDPLQPWQRGQQSRSTGTGFVIDGERLLTNAHVVKSAIDIRVRPHGSTRRFPARVVCYGPDVDLALLEIIGESDHADFFGHQQRTATTDTSREVGDEEGVDPIIVKRPRSSMALEFATELPALQEAVHVVGFPTGGRTICVTEGVVSRIDLMDRIVCIQVDSAINPGSSGGPAFNSKGQVTGYVIVKFVVPRFPRRSGVTLNV